jgi:hypothetical protein
MPCHKSYLKMHMKLLSLLTLVSLAVLPAANAATPASDKGSNYTNPWGPENPQFNAKTGFASWVFDHWNPPTQNPPKPPFFIDPARKAWGINVPANIDGTNNFDTAGYDAAWISFTGDGYLHVGQTFSTTVFFTVPGPYLGPYSTVTTATEGIDFMANSASVPSQYDSFGHQVIGIYLGPSPSGPVFTLAVHPSVSDEKAPVYTQILPNQITPANASHNPVKITFTFTSLPQGNWILLAVVNNGGTTSTTVLTSNQYGLTWNTAPSEGIDAVRYFTSQGGAAPGGPLEWTDMSVSPQLPSSVSSILSAIPLPTPKAP